MSEKELREAPELGAVHDLGCQCWPHVSQRDFTEAVSAVGLAEYRDARRMAAEARAGLDVERLWRVLEGLGVIDNGTWVSYTHADAELIAAEYARLTPAPDDTSAWLIERGQPERQVPTVWWTGSSWSSDANKAMRFPDRGAADAYNEEHSPIPAQRDRFGRVTEHRWLRDTNGGAS